MTKEDFQVLAGHMGATLVFATSPTAVFKGPRYTVTIEATDPANTHPIEAADALATIALVSDNAN